MGSQGRGKPKRVFLFYLAHSVVLHLFLAVDNFSRLSSGAENPGYPATHLMLILGARKMGC